MSDEVTVAERTLVSAEPALWQRGKAVITCCPGCHHPIAVRAIFEAVEELGVGGEAVMLVGATCAGPNVALAKFDGVMCAHGRPADAATAIKRVLRGRPVVFTLQGDGDCIAIGTEALIHAAARGERITVFMLNNGNYGTTGGQMAPTTLIGQRTTTTPGGRSIEAEGYPIRTPELLSSLEGVVYAARGAVHSPAHFQRTKKYAKTAFEKQINNVGFSFVEILSACPADWKLTPMQCLPQVDEIIKSFPLGEFKNTDRTGL